MQLANAQRLTDQLFRSGRRGQQLHQEQALKRWPSILAFLLIISMRDKSEGFKGRKHETT